MPTRLPQGSPVSPVLSNLICRSLDTEFARLCEEFKCHYTRYAGDITISTRIKTFLVFLEVGIELQLIICILSICWCSTKRYSFYNCLV
ncbi:reverse transcriptase domain-containing protein [Albibacterium bauzanense]|uniref:reverse transcriptase domain-containing protein n=1 Tax=Albibacterium bauzanense TaxID=653929 RepID=UPI00104F0445